jgi:cbb3-type cytochrome oxidase subunit 3
VTPQLALLVFGATLCLCLAGLAAYAYARRRKDRAEAPKYRMLEDDDG